MPSFDITQNETIELIEADDETAYQVRITGADVKIAQADDERYAQRGITHPQGYVGPIHNTGDAPVFALNENSETATIELEHDLSQTGAFDPAQSGTVTVTDDGNFNLAGNQDVDIAEQSLARQTTKLEVDNGSGTFGDVHRNGNDLQVSIEQDNATATRNVVLEDVNFSTSQTDALDVSAATVPTEQQTPVALEDDGGTAISTSNPLSVDASQGGTVAVQEDTALDVSGATVSVQEATALDVSGATVNVQEATALDVSAAEVTTANATLATVEHGQDTVSTAGTSVQLNGGTSVSVPDGATVTVRAEVASAGDLVYLGDSTVSSSNGFQLEDGEGVSLAVDDVNDLHIDSDTADDGVSWIVEQ